MEVTFCELREKEIINTSCGKRLGRICDVVISMKSCCVLGVVVPGDRRLLRCREDLFIPWKNICKIGEDVILVDLIDGGARVEKAIVKEEIIEEIKE
jgi:YlmC/YmxH family sporulation protein